MEKLCITRLIRGYTFKGIHRGQLLSGGEQLIRIALQPLQHQRQRLVVLARHQRAQVLLQRWHKE